MLANGKRTQVQIAAAATAAAAKIRFDS